MLDRSRKSATTSVAILGTLLGLVAAQIGAAGGASARPDPKVTWHVSKAFPPAVAGASDSACPTSAACYVLTTSPGEAAGSALASTANGGTTWKVMAMPANFALASAVSGAPVTDVLACPSATTCAVLGVNAITQHPQLARTTDRGLKWALTSLPAAPSGSVSFVHAASMTCLTGTTCLATSTGSSITTGTILRTTNAGHTWKLAKSTSFTLGPISCSSVKSCAVLGAGNLLLTANAGVTWTTRPMPAKSNTTDRLACPTSARCVAAGSSSADVWTTSSSGVTWHSATLAKTAGIQSLSCGSATSCVAVSTLGFVKGNATIWHTSNGGTSWQAQHVPSISNGFSKAYVPSVGLDTAVCTSASKCLIAGGAQARFISAYQFGFVLGTINGGQTWKQRTLPVGLGALTAVTCVSATSCESVGRTPTGVFLDTSNGGNAWRTQLETVPEVGGLYNDVACPSSKLCIAVGDIVTGPTSGNGVIARSTDRGKKWSTHVEASAFQLSGVSCPSTKICVAVGFASTLSNAVLLKTTNAGRTWVSRAVPAGVGRLTEVACASTTHCEAVGDASSGGPVIIATSNATKWTKQALPKTLSTVTFLTSIACPTTKVCEATGGVFNSSGILVGTRDAGKVWKAQKTPAHVGQLNAVDCASATRCEAAGSAAAGQRGALLTTSNAGSSWSVQHLPAGVGALLGLSCPSVATCYAAGETTSATGLLLKTK